MDPNVVNMIALSLVASLGTTVGGLVVLVKRPGRISLGFLMGLASGIMIMLSLLGLVSQALRIAGVLFSAAGFVAGSLLMLLLDFLLPHMYFARERRAGVDGRFLKVSLLLAIGISLHNFPEGIAVASGYSYAPALGMVTAIAIALHNIPEGMAVSLPMCAAGAPRSRACALAMLSGFVEPVGALVAALFLESFQGLVPFGLAFAGGVMVFVTLDELIPVAHEVGHEHFTSFGVIAGCILTFALLAILG